MIECLNAFCQWTGMIVCFAILLCAFSFLFYYVVLFISEFASKGAQHGYYTLRYWLWYAVHKNEKNLCVCKENHRPVAFFMDKDCFNCPVCEIREAQNERLDKAID